MSARTGFPGTIVDLVTTVGTTANNGLPGGWLGYVEITASQTGITTSANITGLSQAVTVNTSRRIKIHAYCPDIVNSTAVVAIYELYIMEGSTQLTSKRATAQSGTSAECGVEATVVLTPSAGSHTYKVMFAKLSGTGTASFGAHTDAPAFLLIEDVGGL